MSEGVFHSQFEGIKAGVRNRLVPSNIISRLHECLLQAIAKKEAATIELDSVEVDKWGRFKFAMWGERRLMNKYMEFKRSMDEVDRICTQIYQIQTGPSSTFLRPECFKVKHEGLNAPSGGLLALSDIREVEGNFARNNQRVKGKYILESKARENDVKFISSLLDKTEQPFGLPRCLGYRQPPYNDATPPYLPIYELVFEAPAFEHQSLSSLLTNEAPPDFERRIELAKQTAKAVFHIHQLGIVHKSIRSRAILVANWNPAVRQPLSLYLLDWTCMRRTIDSTSVTGGDLSWHRMIYQHPDRQGSPGHYPEKEYEPQHDIYSLGIVLLEILLWTPFITETTVGVGTTGFNVSSLWQRSHNTGETYLQITSIFEQRALQLGESNGGLPRTYAGNSVKLASRPQATKNVWKSLTTEDLAAVNKEASQVVVDCLDGHLGTVTDVLRAMDRIY